jgi:signal transduction histidine kinase
VSLVAQAPEPTRRARLVRVLRERPGSLNWAIAVVLPAAVAPLALVLDDPQEVSAGRIYLLVVAVVAFLGGLGPALLATALSFTALAWLFAPPDESVADPNQLGALALFVIAALVISDLLERRTTAERDAAEARRRAERLQRVTAALVEADATEQIVDVILDEGIAASGAIRGVVALMLDDRSELEIVGWRNYPDSMVADFGRFSLEAELPMAEVVRTGVPLFFASRRERDERYPRLTARTEKTHALAVVPLVGNDRPIGACALGFADDRSFSEEDRRLLDTIARQSAQALERAQLREREVEARRELALQTAILEAESEASADGILLVSPDGRMLSFNRRFVELWDLPAEVVASRFDAGVLRAIEDKLAEPQQFYERVAYFHAHPDEKGRDEIDLSDGRIVDSYSSPVRSAAGELFGRVWYFRDITELRRGQEIATVLAAASDLLASTTEIEAVLQLVVRLPVPRLVGTCVLYLLDEAGSPRLAALAHWDGGQEAAMRDFYRRFPIEEGPILEALETRESIRVAAHEVEPMRSFASDVALVIPLVAHGLTYGALAIGAAPRRAVLPARKHQFGEELARRIAIALDNARLYAEAERRGDAARSLEHVADCVVLVDRDARLRYWNPAAENLLSLDSDALGRPMTEAVAGWGALGEQLGPAGDTRTLPMQLLDEERWVAVSAVRFGDGSVYTLRDVTEERTLETMRADFVSTASHELRTPLTAVYGAARTLLRDDVPLSDEHRDSFLRMIAAESERLATIVNDILLAGSLDADNVEFASARCDVSALLGSIVESARMRLPENIELTLVGSDGAVAVECDEERVRQVLVNLVDNAIKYSPDGGAVEVELDRLDGSVRFAVRDRGLGIPASQRARVFDKFIRLDPNLHRGIGGTGLGLYICRELVRRMGGRIWVDGRDGGGSAFYVELPATSVGASK